MLLGVSWLCLSAVQGKTPGQWVRGKVSPWS